MKIQSHLFLLTVGAVAPLVAVLAAGGIMLWKAEREALVREAIGRTRAAMSAIDTELRTSITAMNALAASKTLEAGDLRAFHAEAQRVLATQPQWRNIKLASIDRVQLIDAVRPFGQHARFGSGEGFDDVVRSGAPTVGSLAPGNAVPELSVRVRVPVIVRGQVRYVLTAPIDPASFGEILRAQRLPAGWTIALADRSKRLIARIPQVPAGTPVSPSFGAAIDRSPEGWFRGETIEHAQTYTPYVTSEVSGWVLGIAMPAEVVEAGAGRATKVASIGGLVALAIALALAWIIAQRIAGPIARLARAADEGLDGRLPPLPRIEEIARLQTALADATSAVRERQKRLESEQAILVSQSALLESRTQEAETLMQVMPIAVFKAEDRECRVVTANPAGLAFLGLPVAPGDSNAARAIQWPASMKVLRDGSELSQTQLPLAQTIARGSNQPGEELEFRFADDVVKFGFVFASPLLDASGEARGAVCAILDITERKQDDRRKDEFLATLAHELRNPLAPAMNALELLRTVPRDSSEAQSARAMLDRQVRQMKRLIDDLMDISRITQGKLALRREPVALSTVVENAIDACRPLLKAKSHQLDVELPRTAVQLDGDGARLTQLLSNLLSNSCKFTPPGGRIGVHAHCDGADLILTVSDNGSGIAPALLPRVFDLFVQGDASLERTADGLGIGLSLVQRIAEMHGGTIEALSRGVGEGAEFLVRLPIVTQQPAAPSAADYPKEEAMTLRILVVDDSRDAAESLATLLRLNGHTVEIAADGLTALSRAEQERPDVVFMDIGMPRLNGYDAARQIRAAPWGRRMMLVAISGWGQESDRVKSKEAGFDEHLVKPVEFVRLEQILAAVSERLQGTS